MPHPAVLEEPRLAATVAMGPAVARIAYPSGTRPAVAAVTHDGDAVQVHEAIVYRITRRLKRGALSLA